MSPDNMPDFDKMTPEEMMAWMESLAKRQGATEGLTTDADVDIPEIDPSTVVIDEPGYVPFGEERKAEAAKETPVSEPKVEAPKPVEPPPVRVQETPPAPPSVPERHVMPLPPPAPERPAAAKPVEPIHREPERPAAATKPVEMPRRQPDRPAVPPPAEPARRPTPPPPWEVERPAASKPSTPSNVPSSPPPATAPTSARSSEVHPIQAVPAPVPASELKPVQPPLPAAPPAPPTDTQSVDAGALAWLESLAAEQGDDLFNLDLSGVSVSSETEPDHAVDNPMGWLEDLARSQTGQELPALQLEPIEEEIEEGSEKIDPFASSADPVEWLETLARRQGADTGELTTSAHLNIPIPDDDAVESEAYTPFSFDSPLTHPYVIDEDKTPVNPAEFLTNLAGEEGYSESGVRATLPLEEEADTDEDMSISAIQSAISSGTVTPDQMQFFLDQQADQLAHNPDMLITGDEEVDEDALILEIPDWLQEMRPVEEATPAAPTKPLESLFEVQAESLDIPDWLKESDGNDQESEISGIFAEDDSEPIIVPAVSAVSETLSAFDVEVDPTDPWVEALDLEHEQGGAQDLDVVPEWYERNINDPERLASVERQFLSEPSEEALVDVPLPAESSLPAGQSQPVPSWLTGFEQVVIPTPTPTPVIETTPFTSDMPDWLKEIEIPDDVPDWLVETFPEVEEAQAVEEPVPEPEPVPVSAPPRPVTSARPAPPPPRPVMPPTYVTDEDAASVLQNARDLEQAGDLETSLSEYEGLIRANQALDAVVEDLSQLLRSYRTVPAVYRVLGDGLMRQGKLQAALNTYREALNQL